MAAERRPHEIGDRRVADRFDVMPADREIVDLQQLPRGIVQELDAALRVDDDDSFDHPGENGRHSRAVARQLDEPFAELLDRPIQLPRCPPDLVVAVVDGRRREVALAIPASEVADRPDAPIEPPADNRRESRGPRRRHHDASGDSRHDDRPVGLAVRERREDGRRGRERQDAAAGRRDEQLGFEGHDGAAFSFQLSAYNLIPSPGLHRSSR